MYFICIPNINHDYINIISDEYNINIDKHNATFIEDYYFYKVDRDLNSSASFSVKNNNGESLYISNNINSNNYNQLSIYNNNYDNYYYDNGIAKIYHEDNNNYKLIIALINNHIIEFTLN
jgi:hypothetical protein